VAFSFSTMLADVLPRALNHLLDSDPALGARLAPFPGEVLELRAPPLPPLSLAIAAGGRFQPAPPGTSATLTVTLGPGALAAAVRGEDHFLRQVEVAGNAQLAAEVMFLFRHLRWDAEEDLSKLLGDVAAHRVAGAARAFAALHAEGAWRIAEGMMEYALEERPILVSRRGMEPLASGTSRLRDDLERLEQRIRRLEGP
jgi:ubiquinone biosynthesis protein UbiJ